MKRSDTFFISLAESKLQEDATDVQDAVEFNATLNPKLFNGSQMDPKVRLHLLKIAQDFIEFIKVPIQLRDVVLVGSNASYTYTPHSDVDVHVMVELGEQCQELTKEFFLAKKGLYNASHDIMIRGFPVELYLELTSDPPKSSGKYSILKDMWLQKPKKVQPDLDDGAIKSKYDAWSHAIQDVIESNDFDKMTRLMNRLKAMRKSGLAKKGEFSTENLVFKLLRTREDIKKLVDAKAAHVDDELSLPLNEGFFDFLMASQPKKIPKSKVNLEDQLYSFMLKNIAGFEERRLLAAAKRMFPGSTDEMVLAALNKVKRAGNAQATVMKPPAAKPKTRYGGQDWPVLRHKTI